jgi:glutathione S-transferase
MSLKIYGVLRSRTSRNVWLAKELRIPYELIPVIQARRLADPDAADAPLNTASPSFRAINPNGLIPSIDDDGFILSESLAINLYLAKKHGGALAPVGLREDGLMTMWSIWAVGECETAAVEILLNTFPRAGERADPSKVEAAIAKLHKPFGAMDTALRNGNGFLVGGRFTVADINVAEICRYAQPAKSLFNAFPVVKAWLDTCQTRPAFIETMAAREKESV